MHRQEFPYNRILALNLILYLIVSAQDALIYGDNELTPSTIATNLFLGLTLSSLARLNLYPVNYTTLLTSRCIPNKQMTRGQKTSGPWH